MRRVPLDAWRVPLDERRAPLKHMEPVYSRMEGPAGRVEGSTGRAEGAVMFYTGCLVWAYVVEGIGFWGYATSMACMVEDVGLIDFKVQLLR